MTYETVLAERARFELAVISPSLKCQFENSNNLIVRILYFLLLIILSLFCPDSVPKQNNKNN